MKIAAKRIGDVIEPAYEVYLECAHCGMEVDAEEYKSGTCEDCGQSWAEKRHVAIHVTSVPASGESM